MSWATCSVCGATFTGDRWFDRHRVNVTGRPGYDPEYDWRCSSPDEMRAKGWAQTATGSWQGDPGRVHPLARSAPEAAQAAGGGDG
jgi:hypothetical protein